MGAADPNKNYRASGRIAYGCTDLSAAFPHGGTELGVVGKIYLSPPSRYAVTEREEDNSVGKVYYLGGRAVLGVELLQWDDDALSDACFPSTTGTVDGELIEWPGTGTQPGEEVTALTNVVFSPTNPTHPGVVLYKAYPVIESNQRLQLSSYRVLSVMLLFEATEDSNGRHAAMGPLGQIPGVS